MPRTVAKTTGAAQPPCHTPRHAALSCASSRLAHCNGPAAISLGAGWQSAAGAGPCERRTPSPPAKPLAGNECGQTQLYPRDRPPAVLVQLGCNIEPHERDAGPEGHPRADRNRTTIGGSEGHRLERRPHPVGVLAECCADVLLR